MSWQHCKTVLIVALFILPTATVQRVEGDERYRRAASLPTPRCNDWSDWINRNHPGNNTDELERLTELELDQICPKRLGANITGLKCVDEKGEPVQNVVNRTSADKVYVITCNKPNDGAICHVIKQNGYCPDYSVSFMCSCVATSTPATTYAVKRAASLPAPRCNDWSDWINRHHPGKDTDEIERLTEPELNQICPQRFGATITMLRCADSKGEPFRNAVNITSGDKRHVYTCNKPIDGAVCHIIIPNSYCPDYSVSFMCTCMATSTPTSTQTVSFRKPGLTNGVRPSTTVTIAGRTSTLIQSNGTETNPPTTNDVPRRSLLLWLIPTVVAVVVVVGCCMVLIIFVMKKKTDNQTMSG